MNKSHHHFLIVLAWRDDVFGENGPTIHCSLLEESPHKFKLNTWKNFVSKGYKQVSVKLKIDIKRSLYIYEFDIPMSLSID